MSLEKIPQFENIETEKMKWFACNKVRKNLLPDSLPLGSSTKEKIMPNFLYVAKRFCIKVDNEKLGTIYFMENWFVGNGFLKYLVSGKWKGPVILAFNSLVSN